jgi:heat-inducible transcriptional repressor
LKQLQIIPLTRNSAVAILITDTGYVEHRTFSISEDLDPSDLEKTVNILNEKLTGVPIIDLNKKIANEVEELLKKHIRNFEGIFQFLQFTVMKNQPTNVYVGGKTNIMLQPEFKDLEKIRSLLSMMDEEDSIASFIKPSPKGINVVIGHENEHEAMTDCSVITATYRLGDEHMGTIALLGPTRMNYAKVITLLNEFSNQMTNAFKSWYQNS